MGAPERWTILKLLEWIQGYFDEKGLPTPRLDAEVIVAHVLGLQRVMLYARFDQPLQASELAEIKTLVARRARREPVAHLVGQKEFWSLELTVNADCLIPRPDSETVVEVAMALTKNRALHRIVDVGTGSGCLALALANEHSAAQVYALERSAGARRVANANAHRTGLADRVHVLESDLLDGLPPEGAPVDLLVANLPYIPTADLETLMPDVRHFEPRLALDGGPDGLDLYRRLLEEMGPDLMRPGGVAVLEAGPEQITDLADLVRQRGWVDVTPHDDGAGRPRVVAGRAPTPRPTNS